VPLVRCRRERETERRVTSPARRNPRAADARVRAADPSELAIWSPAASRVDDRLSPPPLAGTDARALTVVVVRYTPQAVFIANSRGTYPRSRRKMAGARRGGDTPSNNQRSFLKATLPEGSIVWSAQVGGRPIRPAWRKPRHPVALERSRTRSLYRPARWLQ